MGPCLDENVLAQFAEGILPKARAAEVETHIDACSRCAALFAEFARTLAATSPALSCDPELPWLAPGAEVGRYVVEEHLGSGGMGQVYAARDPDLGRKVAIKVVQRTGADPGDERLVREAKAMARLSHPNVVAVHDVGTVGGRAFIAMELVVGETLGSWCKTTRRDWRDVVRVFSEAGAGLAAAHDAGIVHRDFKPGNVLIREDGRVQVTDFGLAREQSLPPEASSSISGFGTGAITQTGAILGTPAYMAPEQLRGGRADAISDQYSFCVALHEALYGKRPFDGEKLSELAERIESGELRPAPRDTAVPAHLRRVLERGLRAAPEERFANMHALLSELGRDRVRARRRWLAGAAIAAGIALGGFALYRTTASASSAVCSGGEAALARVWNPERRTAARNAFAATGVPFAGDTWKRVKHTLTAYADELAQTHRAACEATHVRGEQSAEVLDLRMACLDRRRRELDALLEIFAEADAAVVENAPRAAHALGDLDSCSAFRVLAVRDLEPEDEATAQQVNRALDVLARARALRDAGKHTEAIALAEEVKAESEQIGYRRLESEVYAFLAAERIRSRDPQPAEKLALESLLAAEAGGDSVMVSRAAMLLANLAASDPARGEEADRWVRQAAAALERVGPNPKLERSLATTRASIAFQRGDYQAALEGYERAREILVEALGPEHPEVATVESQIASVYYELGRYADAVAAQERVLAVEEEAYGPEHPEIVGALNDLGAGYERLGKLDRAIEIHRRSLALRRSTFGADSPRVAAGLNNLALALEGKGQLAEAAQHLERAAEIYEQRGLEGRHAGVLINLGAVLSKQGKNQAAEVNLRRAVELCEEAFGADHPHTASALTNLAEHLCAVDRCPEAVPLYERSLEIRERKLGPRHVALVYSLMGLAIAYRHLGAPEKGIPLLERALDVLGDTPERNRDAAQVEFNLARALWEAGRDRERARSLAGAALHVFSSTSDERAEEVSGWLEQRSRGRRR